MAGIRFRMAVVLCLLGLASPAGAASFPCHTPFLKPAELAICQDTYLSRLDEDTARKARSVLSRLSYGQYLGLRYWQSRARRPASSVVRTASASPHSIAQTIAFSIVCGYASTAARNGALAGASCSTATWPRHADTSGPNRCDYFGSMDSTCSQFTRLSNQASRYFGRALR